MYFTQQLYWKFSTVGHVWCTVQPAYDGTCFKWKTDSMWKPEAKNLMLK
jgi:hypothetical protein